MAGVDDVFKGSMITAAVVGVGAVLLAPVLMPIFVSLGKPLAKSAIKGGLIVFEKGRETAAELREVFDDLVAESQAELHAQQQQAAGGAAASKDTSTSEQQGSPAVAPA
jgi:hypothetical protein